MEAQDTWWETSTIPTKLRDALHPFQREGVQWAVRTQNGRALIADEMGLGKTLQGLAVASAYVNEWPLLVVVPASVRWSWVDEMERWLPTLLRPANINVVENGNNSEILNPQKLVTIVTFPLMINASISAQVKQRGFKVVVVDESHYLQVLSKP
eukprot:6045532-Pyramimonas_sp.AAC.2